MEKAERTGVESVPGIVEVGIALAGMAMQLSLVAVVMDKVVQLFAKNRKDKNR